MARERWKWHSHLLLIGVHGFLQRDAELLTQRLKLLEVLCVLALVLDLELDACDVLVTDILARGYIKVPRACTAHAYGRFCGVTLGRNKRTLKNAHSGGEVVDTPGRTDSGSDDGWRGNEIVGEAVVQVSLRNGQLVFLSHIRGDTPHAGSACRWGADVLVVNVPEARKHR